MTRIYLNDAYRSSVSEPILMLKYLKNEKSSSLVQFKVFRKLLRILKVKALLLPIYYSDYSARDMLIDIFLFDYFLSARNEQFFLKYLKI